MGVSAGTRKAGRREKDVGDLSAGRQGGVPPVSVLPFSLESSLSPSLPDGCLPVHFPARSIDKRFPARSIDKRVV